MMTRLRPRKILRRAWLLISLFLPAFSVLAQDAPPPGARSMDAYVVLVRHAEKEEGEDPDLSPSGRLRAAALEHSAAAWPLDAIYVSQFRRTQATAVPLADRQGLTAQVVDAGDPTGLAERIRREWKPAVAVVGHSNTVPAVIGALGVEDVPEILEDQYDDLFIVRLSADGGAHLIHLKYGAPSPKRDSETP